MAHRATATGTMNNLWRPKLSLTPPGIVRSIQDRLLTPRSIELSPPSLREIKVMKAGRGSRLTRLKNDVSGRRKKKESFDVVKKMMKKRKGWEKKEEEEKGVYIYICIYCDFLVTSMSHFYDVLVHLFFFFFIRHPISREQRDECASIPRRNSLRRRGAGSILGGRSLIRCWSYWT